VRSLWEQIGFVRDQLDVWEGRNGKRVRLQAYSCHVNISFELGRAERSRHRTFRSCHAADPSAAGTIIVAGANRRSTGIGVVRGASGSS